MAIPPDGRGVSQSKVKTLAFEATLLPFGGLTSVGFARGRPDQNLTFPFDSFQSNSFEDSLTTFSVHSFPGGPGGMLLYPCFTFDGTNLRTIAMANSFPVRIAVRPVGGTWIDLDEYRPIPSEGFWSVPLPYLPAGNIEVATFVDGAFGPIPRCGSVRTALSETVFYGRVDTAAPGCTTTSLVLNGGAAQANHYVGARVSVSGILTDSYVTLWNVATKTATVSPALSSAPTSTTAIRFIGDYRLTNPTASRNDGQGCFRPIAILAPPVKNRKSFGIFGTSISSGLGDRYAAGVSGGHGFSWRAIRNELGQYPVNLLPETPILNVARSSSISSESFPSRGLPILKLLSTCDVAIGDLGTNDIALTTQAWQNAILLAASSIGRSVRDKTIFLSTIGPRTSSSDGWMTLANQAASPSTANRLAVNAWMRTTLPGLLALEGVTCYVFEGLTANAVNGSGAPDILGQYWASGKTTDGIHPTELGHAAAATAGRAALQAAGYA